MVQIDWKRLSSLIPENLTEQEKDELYENLIWFRPEPKTESKHLLTLFNITQHVLKYKGNQVESLVVEFDDLAARQGEEEAKRHQALLDEVEKLRAQLARYRGADTLNTASPDAEELQQELLRYQILNEELAAEVKALEKELLAEKRDVEKLSSQVVLLEREKADLGRELAALQDEAAGKQDEFLRQDSPELTIEKQREMAEMIRQKNKHISQLLSDVETVEQENVVLREKLSSLRDELSEATIHLTEITGELTSVRLTCKELEGKLTAVEEQNNALRLHVKELVEQKVKRDGQLDSFSEALNSRVDEWKRILEEKEAQIEELQERLLHLQAQAPNIQLDTERSRVVLLMQTLQQREDQIEDLKQQLVIATKEITESTAIIDKISLRKSKQIDIPDADSVNKLKVELQAYEERMELLKEKLKDSETDSHEKAKELSEVIVRLREYEAGEYGLSEAVAEINTLKQQLQVRDKQIEEIVQASNKLQAELMNLEDQNSALREKLGLPADAPVTVNGIVSKRRKDQLLLRVLQQQSERLQEEKLHVQLENRKLNKRLSKLSEKLSELGVKPPDELDMMMLSPSGSPKLTMVTNTSSSDVPAEPQSHVDVDKKAVEESTSYLEEQLELMKKDNEALRSGMHEILESIRNQDGSSNVQVESKCLERLLEALDSRHVSGWYHPAMRIQAQLQAVEGKNAVLREQLRDSRIEANRNKQEFQKALSNMEQLQQKLSSLQQDGNADSASVVYQHMGVPENVSLSSAEIISRLNIHLLHVLNEYHAEEERNKKLQNKLEEFEKNYNILRHQMGLLYKEYKNEKDLWQTKEESFTKKKEKLHEDVEGLRAKLKEIETVLNATKETGSNQVKSLLETINRLTSTSEENARNKRKCRTLETWEKHLCKENEKMKQEMCDMECTVMARIGELCRQKDLSFYQIKSLQKILENSVPITMLEAANKQNNELTLKYRDLLLKEENSVCERQITTRLESEIDGLKKDKEELQNILQATREKLHSLEVIVTTLNQDTVTQDTYDNEISLLSKKLATLELKELTERQRGDHAEKMNNILKDQNCQLEKHNADLESRICLLVKENMSLQETERELRDNLLTFVSKEELITAEQKLQQQKNLVVELKMEKERLQEISDIAQEQVRTLELWKTSQNFQLDFLKKEIIELQSNSDDKAVIGRLSHEILASRLAETAALKRVHDLHHRVLKLKANNLHLESKLDDNKKNMNQIKNHMNNRFQSMFKSLQSIRRRYYGSMPLSSQERLVAVINNLREERKDLMERVQVLEVECFKNNNQKEEIKIQVEILKQLKREISSLQITTPYQKQIIEWQNKNMEWKLKELKSRRKAEFMELQLSQVQQRLRAQDEQIAVMEAELMKLETECQDTEFLWDQTHVDMSNGLSKIYSEQREEKNVLINPKIAEQEKEIEMYPKFVVKDIKTVVRNVDGEDVATPRIDESAEQLKQALGLISSQSQSLLKYETQLAQLKSKLEILNQDNENKENQLASRDKIIDELRAHLGKPTEVSVEPVVTSKQDSPDKLTLEATVETLRNTVSQKEESIARYQRLFKDAREDYSKLSAQYRDELSALQLELNKRKEAYNVLKREMQISLPKSRQSEIEQYVRKIKDMEDEVSDLQITGNTLNGQLLSCQEDVEKWRNIAETLQKNMDEFKFRLEEQHRASLLQYSEDNKKLKEELEKLKAELNREQHDGDKASLRTTVSNLRAQLYDKDVKLRSQNNKISELQTKLKSLSQKRLSSSLSVVGLIDDKLESNDNVSDNVERYRTENMKLKNELHCAKDKIQNLQQQLSNRPKTAIKDKRDEKISVREEELLTRVKQLEDELQTERAKQQEILDSERQKIKSAQEVARWDERKKWQSNVEKLKQALKNKTCETESQQKFIFSLKETVNRVEREKNVLSSRLKSAKDKVSPNLEKLESEKSKLQTEVNELKMKLEMYQHHSGSLGTAMLEERLEAQQRRIAVLELARKGNTAVADELENMKQENAILQKANLRLESKNLELQLDLEKMRCDMPRLEEQVEHLQKYVSLLKAEKSSEECVSSPSQEVKVSPLTKTINKKSVAEMEKTIVVMKRVMEKLQDENKQLKEKKDVDQSKKQDLVKKLKNELESVMNEKTELQEKLLEMTQISKEMENELEKTHMQITLLEDRLKSAKRQDTLSDELSLVKSQLSQKSQLLEGVKGLLKRAAIKERALLDQVRLLQSLIPEDTLRKHQFGATPSDISN